MEILLGWSDLEESGLLQNGLFSELQGEDGNVDGLTFRLELFHSEFLSDVLV